MYTGHVWLEAMLVFAGTTALLLGFVWLMEDGPHKLRLRITGRLPELNRYLGPSVLEVRNNRTS